MFRNFLNKQKRFKPVRMHRIRTFWLAQRSSHQVEISMLAATLKMPHIQLAIVLRRAQSRQWSLVEKKRFLLSSQSVTVLTSGHAAVVVVSACASLLSVTPQYMHVDQKESERSLRWSNSCQLLLALTIWLDLFHDQSSSGRTNIVAD